MSEKQAKWDTSLGMDYSCYFNIPKYGISYSPHDFPPLFHNTRLISQYDLEGRGDGFQIAKKGDYLYFCHFFSTGFSVVDVKDPAAPKVVKYIPSGNPLAHNIKCRVFGDILIVQQGWNAWVPMDYHLQGKEMKKVVTGGREALKMYAGTGPKPRVTQNIRTRGVDGPTSPIESGISIYDISSPDNPQLVKFWAYGGGCHRFSYDGQYVYLSIDPPGYEGRILMIGDLSDPKNPKEVAKFWYPGQWTAGGERWAAGWGGGLHHPIVDGDRLYAAWGAVGGAIIDISKIHRPTLISMVGYDQGGNHHTYLPIKNRQFAILNTEHNHAWMLDISDERFPKVVGMFPRPPKELLARGADMCAFGPGFHNFYENYPGPDAYRSDDRIYATCTTGGLRIYDTSDPYRIREIGSYVPGTPKVAYDPRGPLYSGVDVADVWVDNKGLIYLSGYNGGLEILEFTG